MYTFSLPVGSCLFEPVMKPESCLQDKTKISSSRRAPQASNRVTANTYRKHIDLKTEQN